MQSGQRDFHDIEAMLLAKTFTMPVSLVKHSAPVTSDRPFILPKQPVTSEMPFCNPLYLTAIVFPVKLQPTGRCCPLFH